MAGINIENSENVTIDSNFISGYDTGIRISGGKNHTLNRNIIVSKEALKIYGPYINDVVDVVRTGGDPGALLALNIILKVHPDETVDAWTIIGKKYGATFGKFSLSMLSGVMSNVAYGALKALLLQHGVLLP
jgi:hypothetical protein